MWEQYRKGIIPTQALILSLCAVFLYEGIAPRGVLIFFLMMQCFAIFGARWAVRLKGKFDKSKTRRDGLLR